MAFNLIEHQRLPFIIRPSSLLDLKDFLTADVRRHDEHGILEIDGSSLRISQPSLIKDLQQQVERLMMGLLNFVQQNDAKRTTPDRLR